MSESFESSRSTQTARAPEQCLVPPEMAELFARQKSEICAVARDGLACIMQDIAPIVGQTEHIRSTESASITLEEKKFLEKYNILIQALSEKYGIPRAQFLSLIERETNFQDDFQSKKKRGSFGFGQLMKVVFEDMKASGKDAPGGRSDRYVPGILQGIQDESFRSIITAWPQGVKANSVFKALAHAIENGKVIDKNVYNHAIDALYRLAKQDQYINLFVSSVFQDALSTEMSGAGERRPQWYERARSLTLRSCAQTKDAKLQKMVSRWTGEVVPLERVQKYRGEVENMIRTTDQGYQDFLKLLRYSGNTTLEPGEKIPHQVYYAMSIMIRAQMRNAGEKV